MSQRISEKKIQGFAYNLIVVKSKILFQNRTGDIK